MLDLSIMDGTIVQLFHVLNLDNIASEIFSCLHFIVSKLLLLFCLLPDTFVILWELSCRFLMRFSVTLPIFFRVFQPIPIF